MGTSRHAPARQSKVVAALVRQYLSAHAKRADALGASLFADPAWTMLLDLYAADVEGSHVSVSSACMASGAPQSTALLWLSKLQSQGLIERQGDPDDRRRTFVSIRPNASRAVERWALQTIGDLAGTTAADETRASSER